jgi:hypothetical protein
MSSLINSASPWTNNENSKKRISTMRKTIKKPRQIDNDANIESFQEVGATPTIEELQNISNDRNTRVNELINKMAHDNDESELSNFEPISPPNLQIKKDIQSMEYSKDYNPTVSTYLAASNSRKYKIDNNSEYSANNMQQDKLSNYNKSYDTEKKKPYYANMGITSQHTQNEDGKLMDRINYMIHLLEGQQKEKTDNITEEFILYTFLGVFVIFVVDSFSRTGTYKR